MMMHRPPFGMFCTASFGPPLPFSPRQDRGPLLSFGGHGRHLSGGSTISDVRRFRASSPWLRSSPNCVKS